MKKIVALVAAVAATAFIAGTASAKDWKEVKIGTEGAYPPFNYKDAQGQLKGFDVEIALALCAKMKAKCTVVAQDWDGIIPGLLAKKYDAIVASMSITEERKKRVDFTEKYYQTPARFMAKKGVKFTNTPEALKGKTLGAQKATTHSTYLEDNYKGSSIKLYDTQEQANLDLKAGRLDAVLADSVVLSEWLTKTDEGKCCAFVGAPIYNKKWFGEGAGIAVRKEDKDLKTALNKALVAIRKDGTYKKINAKYFPFDIYGK